MSTQTVKRVVCDETTCNAVGPEAPSGVMAERLAELDGWILHSRSESEGKWLHRCPECQRKMGG